MSHLTTGDPKRRRVDKNGRVEPPTWRRQFNQSFYSPDGNFSITKTIAVASQVMVLYWSGVLMDELIERPESLLILLSFLIAPDIIKKALTMKLGGAKP